MQNVHNYKGVSFSQPSNRRKGEYKCQGGSFKKRNKKKCIKLVFENSINITAKLLIIS